MMMKYLLSSVANSYNFSFWAFIEVSPTFGFKKFRDNISENLSRRFNSIRLCSLLFVILVACIAAAPIHDDKKIISESKKNSNYLPTNGDFMSTSELSSELLAAR